MPFPLTADSRPQASNENLACYCLATEGAMSDNRVAYIAKVLAELVKIAEEEQSESSRLSMLIYLLSLALAETDDLLNG